jgi:hypothetical protein
MKIVKGDLWDFWELGWKIVVSTNIGWGRGLLVGEGSRQHANNMGAGIAWQAASRWPWLPLWLGEHYRARHRLGATQQPVEHDQLRLIFVPVKPLLESDPAYSWNQRASVPLIDEQLNLLTRHRGKIALGFVGCGNGGLRQDQVMPALLRLEMRRAHQGHGDTLVVDKEAL